MWRLPLFLCPLAWLSPPQCLTRTTSRQGEKVVSGGRLLANHFINYWSAWSGEFSFDVLVFGVRQTLRLVIGHSG